MNSSPVLLASPFSPNGLHRQRLHSLVFPPLICLVAYCSCKSFCMCAFLHSWLPIANVLFLVHLTANLIGICLCRKPRQTDFLFRPTSGNLRRGVSQLSSSLSPIRKQSFTTNFPSCTFKPCSLAVAAYIVDSLLQL